MRCTLFGCDMSAVLHVLVSVNKPFHRWNKSRANSGLD